MLVADHLLRNDCAQVQCEFGQARGVILPLPPAQQRQNPRHRIHHAASVDAHEHPLALRRERERDFHRRGIPACTDRHNVRANRSRLHHRPVQGFAWRCLDLQDRGFFPFDRPDFLGERIIRQPVDDGSVLDAAVFHNPTDKGCDQARRVAVDAAADQHKTTPRQMIPQFPIEFVEMNVRQNIGQETQDDLMAAEFRCVMDLGLGDLIAQVFPVLQMHPADLVPVPVGAGGLGVIAEQEFPETLQIVGGEQVVRRRAKFPVDLRDDRSLVAKEQFADTFLHGTAEKLLHRNRSIEIVGRIDQDGAVEFPIVINRTIVWTSADHEHTPLSVPVAGRSARHAGHRPNASSRRSDRGPADW